jgi:hypothetical protein
MDAITELTNNFGDEASLQTLSEATKDYPDRLLRKLTVLDSVLTWWYCGWWMPPTGPKQVEEGKLLKMANVVKEKTCHGVPSHLPDDKTSKETWDNICGQGRCQFHEQDQGKKDRNFGLQSHAEVPKVPGHLRASDLGIATYIPGDRHVPHYLTFATITTFPGTISLRDG